MLQFRVERTDEMRHPETTGLAAFSNRARPIRVPASADV